MESFLSKAAAAGIVGLLSLSAMWAVPAEAATIQFASPDWVYNNTNPADQPNWLVEIDDETAGFFHVSLSIDSPSFSGGDVLGFGFDTLLTGLTQPSFSSFSTNTGEGITGFFTNSLSCGAGGCNFNGATTSPFDYILRIGMQGAANGLVAAVDFLIANTGNILLDEDTFTRVGIRAQSTSTGGSTKDINSTPQLSPVPLPPAMLLFATGLAGLAAFRKWRRGSPQAAAA